MVLPVTLREAIAEAIAEAYDLADVCVGLVWRPGPSAMRSRTSGGTYWADPPVG
jgi:hypothetical protein